MNADLTQISVLLSTLVAIFGVLWMVMTTRKMNRKLSEYEPVIEDFAALFRYQESEDGKPMLDARLVSIAEAFSSGVAKSLQASFMGQQSGVARLDKGLKGAMAADVVEQKMPIINLLGDIFGINTISYVKKHPDAMMQLAAKFAPQIQGFLQNRNDGGQPSRKEYM